jgi:type IV pilus assembly protein PilW
VPARRQAGVTLVELMVATGVGLLLVAGILRIFSVNSDAARFGTALARLQESGRFALDEMANDLRMAGYLGCRAGGTAVNVGVTGAGSEFDPLLGLQGWEADDSAPGEAPPLHTTEAPVDTDEDGWTTDGGATLEAFAALPGSDIVRTWRAEPDGLTIEGIDGSTVTVGGAATLAAGDLVTFADCQQLDIVRVCGVSAVAAEGTEGDDETEGTAATSSDLALADGDGCPDDGVRNVDPPVVTSLVGGSAQRLTGSLYYVGKRDDEAASPPALFRRRLTGDGTAGPAEELVAGVENLQLAYGVDTDDDRQLDEYVAADAVDDWTDVLAVRIELLLTSEEDRLVEAPQTLRFNDSDDLAPGDHRLRQTMGSTVALRNRTF